eukprot:CAMPEP_0178438220 /NCGR_PEP_ID=MMETSP0689_2-20121128/35468_1 /TAXON_ID=160604 /ORGANISM="Amphidinium massartii, Strain CS-259" /LENGTH=89 /DNA_ID=CAMNT_0020060591 /DNA_START=30 /DNA_END=299 /DNA_ORIENTATION=+
MRLFHPRGLLLCLWLLFGVASAGFLVKAPHRPSQSGQCKSLCQRFGMKLLAKFWTEFKDVHHPTECCKVCDKVLPASAAANVTTTAANY